MISLACLTIHEAAEAAAVEISLPVAAVEVEEMEVEVVDEEQEMEVAAVVAAAVAAVAVEEEMAAEAAEAAVGTPKWRSEEADHPAEEEVGLHLAWVGSTCKFIELGNGCSVY